MSAAWLTYPLMLDGSRDFECDPLDAEQCAYYMQRWHFWWVELSKRTGIVLTRQVYR